MAEELTMPRLSDTMEQGTIGRWVKHEGDAFAEGEVIAEIETDKATMDFQAYSDGTLLKILVGDGESAALGAPIAIVGQAGEEVPETAPSGNGSTTAAADDKPAKANKRAKDEPAAAADPAPRPAAGGTFGSARSRGGWPTRPASTCPAWPAAAAALTAGS
ncbi:MAG TPA: lipoyl domain-containing protein [Thermoleophilia bacterium]|nr:lipoyl domain-containing protein [Thermoleophilia bacterium]